MKSVNIRCSLSMIVFAFISSCGFDCSKYLENQIKPLVINGVVIEKFKSQTGCFGSIIYKSEKNIDTLKSICYCVPGNEKIWDYVMSGDSIVKNYDQTFFKVVRKSQTIKFEFPCCSR